MRSEKPGRALPTIFYFMVSISLTCVYDHFPLKECDHHLYISTIELDRAVFLSQNVTRIGLYMPRKFIILTLASIFFIAGCSDDVHIRSDSVKFIGGTLREDLSTKESFTKQGTCALIKDYVIVFCDIENKRGKRISVYCDGVMLSGHKLSAPKDIRPSINGIKCGDHINEKQLSGYRKLCYGYDDSTFDFGHYIRYENSFFWISKKNGDVVTSMGLVDGDENLFESADPALYNENSCERIPRERAAAQDTWRKQQEAGNAELLIVSQDYMADSSGQYFLRLTIQSKVDILRVNEIIVNRGNCDYVNNRLNGYRYPITLKYGYTVGPITLFQCKLLEVFIKTDLGDRTFTFN